MDKTFIFTLFFRSASFPQHTNCKPRGHGPSAVHNLPVVYFLLCRRPDADRHGHSAVLKIGVNQAACYVYLPKAVETLIDVVCTVINESSRTALECALRS